MLCVDWSNLGRVSAARDGMLILAPTDYVKTACTGNRHRSRDRSRTQVARCRISSFSPGRHYTLSKPSVSYRSRYQIGRRHRAFACVWVRMEMRRAHSHSCSSVANNEVENESIEVVLILNALPLPPTTRCGQSSGEETLVLTFHLTTFSSSIKLHMANVLSPIIAMQTIPTRLRLVALEKFAYMSPAKSSRIRLPLCSGGVSTLQRGTLPLSQERENAALVQYTRNYLSPDSGILALREYALTLKGWHPDKNNAFRHHHWHAQ